MVQDAQRQFEKEDEAEAGRLKKEAMARVEHLKAMDGAKERAILAEYTSLKCISVKDFDNVLMRAFSGAEVARRRRESQQALERDQEQDVRHQSHQQVQEVEQGTEQDQGAQQQVANQVDKQESD